MKTVVEFLRNKGTDRLRYVGELARLDRVYGWNHQVIGPEVTPKQARQILDYWKPDGCIVNNDALPADFTKGIPTVYLHRDPKTLPRKAALVRYDEREIGDLAARELLQLRLDHYAVVPDFAQSYWSAERESGFLAAMQINLKGVSVFSPTVKSRQEIGMRTQAISEWLSSLPLPLGVFAVNDEIARDVVSACLHSGLCIPEDVAVVGVDNDETICEATNPTISSVAFGATALLDCIFATLDRLMANKPLSSRCVPVQPTHVVRRMSTTRLPSHDSEVAAALDLIRQKACTGLTAADVAATFRGGLRQAQRRFKAVTGTTIVSAIVDVRLARARELLKDKRLSRMAVANQCGYSSWVPLYLLLRKDDQKRCRKK